MTDQVKIKGLYIIVVWDGEETEALAVTAYDMKEAKETAIQQIKDGRAEENDEEPRIDDRYSFEVTCAGDKNGNVYDVDLSLQR
ncbi:hypothetical protein [Paenibacillus prosopidis]|uniref:Uncharacterized protein n=1 Tax=Paenibacillus prosopidis TaxID=630520 RepID=A0A368VJ63_9BACL|nr:hypothetical protein [Paenibacillus prosopidis]RCW41593.1 hypothetical protein DFP97_12229 [Paenibacillus prosopidis]